jgi:hypothetical protein
MRHRNTSILAVLLLCLVAGTVSAQTADLNPLLHDRFAIYLGGFFPDISSEITINGTILPGDSLDFENVLGLEDSKNVLWGGVRWRISRRNMIEFEFADLNRSGTVAGDLGPYQIGEYLVDGMAQIDTTFDVTLGRLTYGFAVIKDEKKQLYLKAGVHIADMGASFLLSGEVCLNPPGPPCAPFTTEPLEIEEITVPLPHFGGGFSYAFTPKLVGRLQALAFALEVNSIDGSLIEVDADLIWTPWRNFGLGAALRYFVVDIEATSSDLNGEFEFKYWGPAIYGIYTF